MKILEIVAGYPDLNGGKASSFIHTRNLYYIQHGITPIVLNFRTDTDYVIDGVQVICLKTFREKYTRGGVLYRSCKPRLQCAGALPLFTAV